MNRENFDQNLKDRLSRPIEAPVGIWEKIEQRLERGEEEVAPVRRSIAPWGYWSAAAAVAAIVTFTLVLNRGDLDQSTDYDINTNEATQRVAAVNSTESSREKINETFEKEPASPIVQKKVKNTSGAVVGSRSVSNLAKAPEVDRLKNDTEVVPSVKEERSYASGGSKTASAQPPIPEEGYDEPALTDVAVRPESREYAAQNQTVQEGIRKYAPSHIARSKKRSLAKSKKVDISFSGGYGKGTVSDNASLAFNATKDISKRLFVEGSMGVVVNNIDDKVNRFNGDFVSSKANGFKSNNNLKPSSGPLFLPISNLVYIQVNPALGYKVTERFKVSVGPDFQKMVSSSEDVVRFGSSTTKLIPKNDIGVSGKLEYRVAPKVSTSIYIREGVNSVFKASKDVVNREYFQLQLKYSF